jgi:hypothetical protein
MQMQDLENFLAQRASKTASKFFNMQRLRSGSWFQTWQGVPVEAYNPRKHEVAHKNH